MSDMARMLRWMRGAADAHTDRHTGEVDATGLAESYARAMGLDDVGGPLDDETHDIWAAAATVASERDRGRK